MHVPDHGGNTANSNEPRWMKIYRRLAAEVEQEKEITEQGDADAQRK